jgi:hypothetical protein
MVFLFRFRKYLVAIIEFEMHLVPAIPRQHFWVPERAHVAARIARFDHLPDPDILRPFRFRRTGDLNHMTRNMAHYVLCMRNCGR